MVRKRKLVEECAAVVTVRCASTMTNKGRADIANWLRRQASNLETNGKRFAKRYRGRYLFSWML